jgi:small GTP-binding protein
MSSYSHHVDLKVVILGAASVGKTCVIRRYCYDQFSEDTLSTIGAGFFAHTVMVDDLEVNLVLWDTAGQERFRSVAPALIRGANALVLVYDTQHQPSFDVLHFFFQMFVDIVTVTSSVMPVLLLGNKSDLGPDLISEQTLKDWKAEHNVQHSAHVSAKTGAGIAEAFESWVTALVETEEIPERPALQIPMPSPQQNSDCC